LLNLPPSNTTYLSGRRWRSDAVEPEKEKEEDPHPTLAAHIENGTATPALRRWYAETPDDEINPTAGVPRRQEKYSNPAGSSAQTDPKDASFVARTAFDRPVLTSESALQEADFHARPMIKIPIPDHIKAILVDDWENVTKNLQLVPLPHPYPVNVILDEYLKHEAPKREAGSAQADILEEAIAGLKEYFERSLGRLLLYR
jgi:hypothetical protein